MTELHVCVNWILCSYAIVCCRESLQAVAWCTMLAALPMPWAITLEVGIDSNTGIYQQ